jgi:Glycosyl hydrolase family 79, N-terminal domain
MAPLHRYLVLQLAISLALPASAQDTPREPAASGAATRLSNSAGPSIAPASMARMGTVGERFQSYNVEMVEVTGGEFWKPYGSDRPAGRSALYAYRPPIDLTNPLLRRLAAALAPAYLRVSGTWANATYFADSDSAPSTPPPGFNGVLSRQQWRGVVDFSQAVGAEIVTSFAVGPGTRDAAGVWLPDQARRFLTYTYSVGGRIAAAEFINEPNLSLTGGAPAGDDAAAYARDFDAFRRLVKENFPEMLVLGPGTVGEAASASSMIAASGPGSLDGISYHHYGTLSERCSGTSAPEEALSEEWLARTDQALVFYRSLRDKFEPGKPIWLTETAEAACGGNRWDTSFLDTFRYLDQLGRLAKAGVQVVMHNTLAAGSYGLLNETTLAPTPNYWGALLWRLSMGSVVLDPGVPAQTGLHVYAHCQRGTPGGVSLLILNVDRSAPHSLTLPVASERYALDAASLQDTTVRLNGLPLRLGPQDDLPRISGLAMDAGALTFAPATITFLTMPAAGNQACP